ncbi:MAG TPA: VWA domain-containing protein [Friedmanniella sp.]
MTPGTMLRRVLLGSVSLLLTAGGLLATAVPAQADEAPKVLLLLDVSGSMNARLDGGQTKFAAAKKALKEVAASLPAGTQVGLRVYGSEVKEDQDVDPAACRDTRLVLPIGPLDQNKMNAAVDSFQAQGATPIAYSMGKAVDDLGDSGKRVLILISDGQETCAKDPCPIVRKLADRGVDLQFNAIGLAVNSKARSQLQCIAKAGGGAYYDANDTSSLDQALRKLTQRALRPFEVAGTPVSGTADPAAAPAVPAGQYRDTYDASGTPRYYTIPRSTSGSLVTAWVSTVVRPYGDVNADNFALKLETLQGDLCSSTSSFTQSVTSATVYSVAVRSDHSESPKQAPATCSTDAQLRLEVTRTTPGGSDASTPVELGVAEQAPVTNRADLPAPVAGYTGKGSRLPAQTGATPVVGGSGFSNAPAVGAGAWSDSIAFGDTALYRVPLDYGQSLKVTASLPGDKGRLPLTLSEGYIVRLKLLTPAHAQLVGVTEPHNGETAVHLSAVSPQVRVRNDEIPLPGFQNNEPDASTASVAGDYYVVVELQPVIGDLTGVVVPLQLDLTVDGTPSGQPVFASSASSSATPGSSATPTPAASPSSAAGPVGPPSSSTPGLLLAGAGIVVLLGVAGAVAALALRRRRRAGRSNP